MAERQYRYPDLETLVRASTRARAVGVAPPVLTIDNDSCYAYEGSEKVFEMHPSELLESCLDFLGIKYEGV